MNKTDVPTYQKIMIPVRMPAELYSAMVEKVQTCKKEKRSFSMNEYITELIKKDLQSAKK